jgi:serine/threonine protein kinase
MPFAPTRIDRYEIKGRIGGGGMGTLYLARDTNPTTDRLVALKLLRTSFESDDLRQRFIREAQALADLSHPNIVTIHDSGEFEDSPFIVMEYVRGETLGESIKRKAPIPLGEKLRLLSELCAGLAHAHEAGIIHRDIKPANLMVDLHGRLKILDFGIARVADAGLTRVGEPLTRLNVQIGTPGYMSPEQIEGLEIDARTDLFAVGAVAYEFISGHEAFSGATTRQIENKVLGEQPVPLVSSIPGLDPAIAEVILSALEKDVQRRCQDAATLERAFARLRARLGSEELPVRPTPPPRQGVERKSRHERAANAAYERAVASFKEGAEGFARRSAMEALAEFPQHEGAHNLLVELGYIRDVEPWLPTAGRPAARPSTPGIDSSERPKVESRTPPPAPPVPVPPLVPAAPAPDLSEHTMVAAARSVPQDPEAASEAPDRTMIAAGPNAPSAVNPALPERTMLLSDLLATMAPEAGGSDPMPAAAGLPAPPPPPPAVGKDGAKKPAPPIDKRGGAKPKRFLRVAYIIAGIVGAVVVAALGGAFVAKLVWPPAPPTETLTINRPEGGTITGEGVKCGTQDFQCSASPRRGATVELRAQADAGFAFSAFTGDCAPSGRLEMTAARQCGATFTREAVAPAAPTQFVLAIDRPTGGTIEGPGIRCGANGADCSVSHPVGLQVTLVARPAAGFALGAFTGDCAAGGATTMTADRRCGATFVPASAPPPAVPDRVLTVVRPTGGTVLGPGIKCGAGGAECVSRYPDGTAVTLAQQAEKGFKFVGFAGDCSPAGRAVMTAARTCSATFAREAAPPPPVNQFVLTVTPPTNGAILGNGIDCGKAATQCSSAQPTGATVRLVAQPNAGFVFTGFTGDCDPGGAAVMTASKSCAATFARDMRSASGSYQSLTVVRPTGGTVIGNGIECGPAASRCSAQQPAGSTLQLRAMPGAGFQFVRFNNCDAGGTLVMDSAKTCAVSFLRDSETLPIGPYQILTVKRPTEGTILGNGIECGASGSQCTAGQPAGATVQLIARPNPGFTFVRFTEECSAGGSAVMSEARTCGAIFAKDAGTPAGATPQAPPAAQQESPPPGGPIREAVVGQALKITVNYPGSGAFQYRWQVSKDGRIWVSLNDSPDYAGTTSDTLTIQQAKPEMNGLRFRAMLTSTAKTVASGSVTLVVKPR